jgi:choice-of-anchor A domain-containing protein
MRIAAVAALLAAGTTVGTAAAASASPARSAAAAATAAAATGCATLPASFGYSEFSPGTVSESNGDSDGPTAYGGSSTLSSFAIANNTALIPASNVAFVAGGPVTGASSTADHYGNGYADNNVTGVSFQNGTLNQVTPANLPVNFTQTAASDASLASQLAALPTTAGDLTATSGTTLTLTATGSPSDNQYVWTLTAGELASITTIKIAGVPSNGSVVVNVPDTGAVSLKVTTVYLDGTSSSASTGSAAALADATIFNFSGASSLGITGTWAGTLFAPGADVTFSSGHVWGTVVGSSLTGSHESTYGPLDTALCLDLGPTNALPEGRPILLAAGGAVVLGGLFLVRRRRLAAA